MARTMPKTDVVFVGVGFTAAIIARELKDASVRMVGLERGRNRHTVPDFQSPAMHDELAYAVRMGLMQDLAKETVTFRNQPDQEALPMRQLGSFLPGTDLGGAGVHWNGQTYRFQAADFRIRSHHEERYGKNFIADELTVQDWGVTYEELEPYYDRFEYLCGISGLCRTSERHAQARRQSVRGVALARLSQSSDRTELPRCAVRQRGAGARL